MAAPDLVVDPDILIHAGRASVDRADSLRGCAGDLWIADAGFPAFAAEQRLRERVRQLAARLRHNGEALEEIGVEARALDGAVSAAFLRLGTDGWR